MYCVKRKCAEFSLLCFIVCISGMSSLQAEDRLMLNQESCISCHTVSKHIDVQSIVKTQCVQCHKTVDIVGENNRVAAHLDALAEVDLPLVSHRENLPPGMSMPPYYKGTRLGRQPNRMLKINSGKFKRGTNDRLPDEGPEHIAETASYWIDKYEVTNLQYKSFIDATHRKSPKHFVNRTYPPGKADHPVVYVTWYDARDYCQWANKRLPTDIEWEKAARTDDGRTYPWGNDFHLHYANTPQRWAELKQAGDTLPVGAFPKGVSGYGLFDMSGNVWEWTSSDYAPYPGNTRINENYQEDYKTLKGGSWWDCTFYKCGISAPVYNRSFFLKTTKNESFGFRCAKNEKP